MLKLRCEGYLPCQDLEWSPQSEAFCADDPAGSKLLMVMEYVEGGPIVVGNSATEKSKLPEIVARRFFRDIILVRTASRTSAACLACYCIER